MISNQSRAVVVLVVLLCAAGIYAAFVLPSSIFPHTDFPKVVVVVDNGDTPAEQMLVTVTRPIEQAMNGIPGIARIKSATSRGSTEINLFFDWNTNPREALQLVQTRLTQVSLPPTAQIRHVERLTFAVFPVISYSLTSEKLSPAQVNDLATYTIKPRLARLAGVSDVQISGGKVRGGVLLGLLLTGMTLNVVSFMGMIMVVGIVAKNGILMLDAVEEHIDEGDNLQEALLKSGRRRFRPVLMTSLAAILGMLPLALAIGAGSELLQPLAIAVISGLIFALMLSLVVTPTVYAMLKSDSAS